MLDSNTGRLSLIKTIKDSTMMDYTLLIMELFPW